MQEIKTAMPSADILIVGAGIVGMSLAMELRARGARVRLLEKAPVGERVTGMASWAAAGMIAAEDPFNPVELQEFSRWSAGMYDGYLALVEEAGGLRVRYQTELTRQVLADGSVRELGERSVDPRELFAALRGAVGDAVTGGVAVESVVEDAGGLVVRAESGEEFRAGQMVWANGAWMRGVTRPVKGQMMRVRLQRALDVVTRAEHGYVVPRTHGVQAGTALVGATVEDVGFDASVGSLEELKAIGAVLMPEIAGAEVVESWMGFRPATANGLPVMGPVSARQFCSGGHFRNGVLLAPASAVVLADLLEGRRPAVDVSAFAQVSR